MIRIFYKEITDVTSEKERKILLTLSESARARLDKKKNDALRIASLCALSLLTDEQRADLAYTESGRPYFNTFDADISITHSKRYCAVAISDSKDERVGVDLEDQTDAIPSSRFLTGNEQIALEKDTPFVELWTKKEALFKFLKNDSIPFIKLDSTAAEQYGAKFITLQIENNVITVCTLKGTMIQLIEK